MERIPSGIIGLDDKIEGGFPDKSSILLFGPSGVGKTVFCGQFIYTGLTRGESGIYITFDTPPEDLINNMKKFGWVIEGKIVVFIDAYSWRVGGKVSDEFVIQEITDLNDFMLKFHKALKYLENKNPKRCAVDSLSTLFLFLPQDLALRFVSSIIGRAKASNLVTVCTLLSTLHTQSLIDSLSLMFDGCIEMNFSEILQKRIMRINKMMATKFDFDWFPYEIENDGIKVIL